MFSCTLASLKMRNVCRLIAWYCILDQYADASTTGPALPGGSDHEAETEALRESARPITTTRKQENILLIESLLPQHEDLGKSNSRDHPDCSLQPIVNTIQEKQKAHNPSKEMALRCQIITGLPLKDPRVSRDQLYAMFLSECKTRSLTPCSKNIFDVTVRKLHTDALLAEGEGLFANLLERAHERRKLKNTDAFRKRGNKYSGEHEALAVDVLLSLRHLKNYERTQIFRKLEAALELPEMTLRSLRDRGTSVNKRDDFFVRKPPSRTITPEEERILRSVLDENNFPSVEEFLEKFERTKPNGFRPNKQEVFDWFILRQYLILDLNGAKENPVKMKNLRHRSVQSSSKSENHLVAAGSSASSERSSVYEKEPRFRNSDYALKREYSEAADSSVSKKSFISIRDDESGSEKVVGIAKSVENGESEDAQNSSRYILGSQSAISGQESVLEENLDFLDDNIFEFDPKNLIDTDPFE